MSELRNDRRAFIVRTCALLTGVAMGPAILGAAVDAAAQEMSHEMVMGHGGNEGYIMSAWVTQHCGTCEFWGGPRRLSEDKKSLIISGLGWCNNPASSNYQKLTTPDHGPMGTWRKWSVLT
jgi:hypothetical protein